MNNNVVEFFVKMKDMISGGLVKMGQTASTTFKNIQNNARGAERQTEFLTHSVSQLRAQLKEVNNVRFGTVLKSEFRQATAEARTLEREIARIKGGRGGIGRGSGGGGSLFGMFRSFMPALTLAAVGFFAMSNVRAANEFGAQKQSYQVLTGNNGIGGALADDLRSLKENTIMGPAVYKNAQTMLGFGIAAKDVTKDLRMLGDISMGDANRLQHLTLAFSEVEAAGKLTRKEVRQFINAGFNPLQEIAKMTGKTMAQVSDQVHKGGVSAAMLAKAFESATGEGGRFHGMLEKMAETGAGKMQKLSGQWASFKIAFGERMTPASNSGVDTLSKIVHWAKELVEIPVAQKLQEQIGKIRGLQAELTASNTSHQRQVEILRELQQINPNITQGINEQSISYQALAKNIDNVTGSLRSKVLAENFSKDKDIANVMDKYSQARKDYDLYSALAMIEVGKANPGLAQDNSLSTGQKQMKAREAALKAVGAHGDRGPGFGSRTPWFTDPTYGFKFRLNDKSKENMTLINLGKNIGYANEAASTIKQYAPLAAEINKTKDALMKQFDQYAGIGSMATAAAVQTKNGKGSNATAADEGGKVGSSITSGGPRTINIHGVKFADKIELHASSGDAAMVNAEKKFEEMFLRVLNSGASVQ